MSPPNAASLRGAAPAKSSPAAKTPVEADIRVCLDFIKGRCTRQRCRFFHPEMSAYQQLSGAIQAQAGKEICEVWAMAGQCKFGAKCNKLHPAVVMNPSSMPVLAVPVPVAVPTRGKHARTNRKKNAAAAAQRQQRGAQPLAPSPLPAAEQPPAPSPLPVAAQPTSAVSPAGDAPKPEAAKAEFQDIAQYILKALETEDWDHHLSAVMPPSKAPSPDLPRWEEGRSLASLFNIDRAFLDILTDLNICA